MKRTMAVIAIAVDLVISLAALVVALMTQTWSMAPGAAGRLAAMGLLGYFAVRKDRPWAAIVIVILEIMTVTICVMVFLIPTNGRIPAASWLGAAVVGVLYGGIGTAVGIGLSPIRRTFRPLDRTAL